MHKNGFIVRGALEGLPLYSGLPWALVWPFLASTVHLGACFCSLSETTKLTTHHLLHYAEPWLWVLISESPASPNSYFSARPTNRLLLGLPPRTSQVADAALHICTYSGHAHGWSWTACLWSAPGSLHPMHSQAALLPGIHAAQHLFCQIWGNFDYYILFFSCLL